MFHNFKFSMKLISFFFLIIGLLRLLFKASLDYFPFHEAVIFVCFIMSRKVNKTTTQVTDGAIHLSTTVHFK